MAKITLDLKLDLPGTTDDFAAVVEWIIRVVPRAPEETLLWLTGEGPAPTWPVLYELTDVLERAFPAQVVDAVGGVGMAGAVVDRKQDASAEKLWSVLRRYREACLGAITTADVEMPDRITAVSEGQFIEMFPTRVGGPRSGASWTSADTFVHVEPASSRPLRSWKVTSSEPFTVHLARSDDHGRVLNVSMHHQMLDRQLGAATISTVGRDEFRVEGADIDLQGEGTIEYLDVTIRPKNDQLIVKITIKAKPKRKWLGALSGGWFVAKRSVQKRVERSANPRMSAIVASPEWTEVVAVARRDRAT